MPPFIDQQEPHSLGRVAAPSCQILVSTSVKANSKQRGKDMALEMLSFHTGVLQRGLWLPDDVKSNQVIAPDCEEYLFTRLPDQASAELMMHCLLGDVLPQVTIEVFTVIGNKTPALKYVLTKAIVTHVKLRIDPGSKPVEHLGFVARQTEWEYPGPDDIPSAGGFDWREKKKIAKAGG